MHSPFEAFLQSWVLRGKREAFLDGPTRKALLKRVFRKGSYTMKRQGVERKESKTKEVKEEMVAGADSVFNYIGRALRCNRGWHKVEQAWLQDLAQECLKQAVSSRSFVRTSRQ